MKNSGGRIVPKTEAKTGAANWQLFHNRKERKEMGLTFANFLAKARELKEAGEIDSSTPHDEIAALITIKLEQDNPTAFAAPGVNWDRIWQLIQTFLPIILKLLGLLG